MKYLAANELEERVTKSVDAKQLLANLHACMHDGCITCEYTLPLQIDFHVEYLFLVSPR